MPVTLIAFGLCCHLTENPFCNYKIQRIMKNGVGDGMCDVELRTVTTDEPLTRALAKEADVEDVAVTTESGMTVTVGVRGDRSKPAVLTYHDIGLNAASNFQAFHNFPAMAEILRNFCVYSVNAPGQEEGAPSWPEEEPYPDMDQLAELVS